MMLKRRLLCNKRCRPKLKIKNSYRENGIVRNMLHEQQR